LVTWEWASENAKRDQKVAAVFNPRLGANRVKEFVEFLYGTEYYSLGERVGIALRGAHNPYPARFGQTPNRVTWQGQIVCGHHPYLYARLVDDLTIEFGVDGEETVKWNERPKPWDAKVGFWSETPRAK
jgi:hypothetical protein